MTSFLGYINNVKIKFLIYFTSHICSVGQIMDIIPGCIITRHPHQEGSPYLPPGDVPSSSVGLTPGNPHQYQVSLCFNNVYMRYILQVVSISFSLVQLLFFPGSNLLSVVKFRLPNQQSEINTIFKKRECNMYRYMTDLT